MFECRSVLKEQGYFLTRADSKDVFPKIYPRMTFHQHYHGSEKDRQKRGVRRGRERGRDSSKDGRQPTTTADSSRSAQEGGGGCGGGGKCVDLCVCLCVCGGWRGAGCAVKALMCAPCSPRAFPFVVGEPAGPSAGASPGESLHHIPFPLFQASFYEQSHPQVLLAFLPAPDVLSFHRCRRLVGYYGVAAASSDERVMCQEKGQRREENGRPLPPQILAHCVYVSGEFSLLLRVLKHP